MFGIDDILIASVIMAGATAASTAYQSNKSRQWSNKMFDKENQTNLENWRNSLLEGPTLQRQGLESAGFNPLLAVDNMSSSGMPNSATPLGAEMPDFSKVVSSAKMGAMLRKELDSMQTTIDNAKKEGDILDETLKQEKTKTKLSEDTLDSIIDSTNNRNNLSALEDLARDKWLRPFTEWLNPEDSVAVGVDHHENFDKFSSAYGNQIERNAYENSLGHAIGEDISDILGLFLKSRKPVNKSETKSEINHHHYYHRRRD